MVKCHHKGCGHEWEPRVKNPKKCPVCQNPLWKSAKPKRTAQTSIAASEAEAPTPPTTDTNTPEPDASGAEAPELENSLLRLQREAEERLRRLADAPVD